MNKMKMIDSKGKLFGKINIIDFLLLLVLVAAIAVLGVKFLGGKTVGDTQTIQMQFYIEEVDKWVAENVKVGDALYDGTFDQELGVVTAVETGEARTWATTADGQYVPATRGDDFKSMIITGEVKGTKTAVGAEVNGERYGVGHSMVLYAGDAKLYLRVYDISVKE